MENYNLEINNNIYHEDNIEKFRYNYKNINQKSPIGSNLEEDQSKVK